MSGGDMRDQVATMVLAMLAFLVAAVAGIGIFIGWMIWG